MKNKIDFCTVFFECTNAELMKDVAQIPYLLYQRHKMKTELVTSKVNNNGGNVECVKGLKLRHFPMIVNGKISGLVFLLFNARKIKWLNIYHIDRKSYYWIKWYKILNPKGHVYLKMDVDFRMCDDFDNNKDRRNVFQKCADIVDLISAESQSTLERVQKYVRRKIELIPNGYCVSDKIQLNNTSKENIFLTVGRLGTEQKATEILLQAFAICAEKTDWNLRLVGNISEEFRSYIEDFFEEHQGLTGRITFVGQLNDRKAIDEEYRRAKVFVLPSRWESFGLVLTEAMANGCRLITTDAVPPIKELTYDGKYGKIVHVNDISALADAMIDITNDDYSDKSIDEIKKYASDNFSWESICDNLHELMEQVI